MSAYRIDHFATAGNHRNPYLDWLRRMRDGRARVAVVRRVNRIELGNFGDHKYCRDGVFELRIDVGSGYRVYYTLPSSRRVLLPCGGDKRTQAADIDRAVGYWQDWQRRADDEEQTP